MSAVRIPSSSREYVKCGPQRLREEGRSVDLTSSTIEFAFTAAVTTEPEEADWLEGSWESGRGRVFARCLVGPGGGTVLAEGTWVVWTRLTRSAELIVRHYPNRLVIT